MTPEELNQANNEQMHFFFQGYDFSWRLTKILSFKMLLENRERLANYLKSYYGNKFNIDDNYIDGSINNGLIYSALVELAMHIEDLLALIKFIRKTKDFAKKITWYRASDLSGSFLKNIKSDLENNPERLLNRFLIPNRTCIETYVSQSVAPASDIELPNLEFYDFGVSSLISYMKTIINAYEKIKSPYEQYKHGLKIRFRDINSSPERRDYHRKIIAGDVLSLHNDTWEEGLQNLRIQPGVIVPDHGSTVTQHFDELIANKNLFQYDQLLSLPMDDLVNISEKVMDLIFCLIKNRADYFCPKKVGYRTIFLPFPQDEIIFYDFYLGSVDGYLIGLDDFESLIK